MQYGKYCLLLRCLILAESPNRARVGKTYIHKGVTVRFGFDVQRTSQLHQYVKNKATGTPHGDVVIYSPLWLWTYLRLESREFIYICISVGLSALLVSAYWAMRRPSERGTSDRLAPRFFCICTLIRIKTAWEPLSI